MTKDAEPRTVVGGNPAMVIEKKRDSGVGIAKAEVGMGDEGEERK